MGAALALMARLQEELRGEQGRCAQLENANMQLQARVSALERAGRAQQTAMLRWVVQRSAGAARAGPACPPPSVTCAHSLSPPPPHPCSCLEESERVRLQQVTLSDSPAGPVDEHASLWRSDGTEDADGGSAYASALGSGGWVGRVAGRCVHV